MQAIEVCNTKLFLIIHSNKVESVSRNTRPGEPSILCVENRRNRLDAQFSRADIQQSAHDGPHHVLEKSAAGYAEDPLVGVTLPLQFKNGSHAILYFTGG